MRPIFLFFFIFFLSLSFSPTLIFGQAEAIKVIGHRGTVDRRPENTLSAYQWASAHGADRIELDVRTAKDGELYLLHDPQLDRTTDGKGNASDFTLVELTKLDAGSHFDPAYASEQIPSFMAALAWAKGAKVPLLLDLKDTGRVYAEKVVRDIKKYGEPANIALGVHSVQQAKTFRALLPEVLQLGFIPNPEVIEDFADAGVEILRLWLKRWVEKDPELIHRVDRAGAKLMLNMILVDKEEFDRLEEIIAEYSPAWILVNDPEQLREALDGLN